MGNDNKGLEDDGDDQRGYSHFDAFEEEVLKYWYKHDNRYRVITRDRLHPALSGSGFGIIDLDGVGLQRIRDERDGCRAADEIKALTRHRIEWPIREWLRRERPKDEIYVLKDRSSRSAIGLIGYRRSLDYEPDDDRTTIGVSFDLSAIYISPDYGGMGCATALFQPIISDLQVLIDHSKKWHQRFKNEICGYAGLSVALTGDAHSAEGTGCGRSLYRAMETAVHLGWQNPKERLRALSNGQIANYFWDW